MKTWRRSNRACFIPLEDQSVPWDGGSKSSTSWQIECFNLYSGGAKNPQCSGSCHRPTSFVFWNFMKLWYNISFTSVSFIFKLTTHFPDFPFQCLGQVVKAPLMCIDFVRLLSGNSSAQIQWLILWFSSRRECWKSSLTLAAFYGERRSLKRFETGTLMNFVSLEIWKNWLCFRGWSRGILKWTDVRPVRLLDCWAATAWGIAMWSVAPLTTRNTRRAANSAQ